MSCPICNVPGTISARDHKDTGRTCCVRTIATSRGFCRGAASTSAVVNNGKRQSLGARKLSVLKAALVGLFAGDISTAHFPAANGLAARIVDAATALPGEATAYAAAYAAIALCVTETDAS